MSEIQVARPDDEVLASSTYLTGLLEKYPDLDQAEYQPYTELEKICAHLQQVDPATDSSAAEQELKVAKARFAFFWSIAELGDAGDFAARGEWQTRFAELTIEFALRCAWYRVADKHKIIAKLLAENQGQMPGLFLFGMGKLGGNDLNFSSDIDLVAYFSATDLPVPEMLGKSYICHQVLQKLTQLLGQNSRPDFIWRVDWRLRPNASATTLAMSTTAAEEYYFFRASPWHRLALMKARIVAGDRIAGQRFMNSITPFIWRQNLDFRALDELGEIKNRVNLEHPGLRAQRTWREPINDEVSGFNVKLGSGGIREIEFIANALQLVWGGRLYELRTANTLQGLRALADTGHLEADDAEALADAYIALRRVENALQITGNQQTHALPSSADAQARLLVLLGRDEPDQPASWQDFTAQLNGYRHRVSEHFEALFAEQAKNFAEPIQWPQELSAAAEEVVRSWERGFHQYGVSIELRHRLLPLTRALASYLAQASDNLGVAHDPNQTIIRLHDFFRSLPQGEAYFRLLAESPELLHSLIPPLLYSPPMSTLLKQSPHIIDCFMTRESLDHEHGFDSSYVLQADNYEVRLERMRRFVNEHLYQLYLQFINGQLNVNGFQTALTALAGHTLDLALQVVAENMQLDEIPITVLGMGKVAIGRMAPMSDLDLIFIYDATRVDMALASKYVSRLQTAISVPMREGVVYELDTRLRPSGRSGAPTVSVESFRNHQFNRAHTWEHIALVPSRVVAGNRGLEEQIHQVKHDVLVGRRDQTQFFHDAHKMWERISEHRLKEYDSSVMFSKLRPGGLMQAEYLAACLILQSSRDGTSIDFDSMLATAVHGSDLEVLGEVIQFWRIQQLWERLLGFTEQPLENLPDDYLQALVSQSGVGSLAELKDKKQRNAAFVIDAMQDIFTHIEADFAIDDWVEAGVRWREDV